jgi:hypothetical protein
VTAALTQSRSADGVIVSAASASGDVLKMAAARASAELLHRGPGLVSLPDIFIAPGSI